MPSLSPFACLCFCLTACGAATAESASPSTLAFNAGVVTDYRYRGISQSRLQPALQAGVDYAHASGFYLGAWGSTIRWIRDIPGGGGDVELDLYGGYKGQAGPLSYDVGALRYQYPRHHLATSPNTDEVYAAGTWGPATLKYSRSVGNLFGVPASSGSGYLDLSASLDLGGGWSLVPHLGRQSVRGSAALSYNDYSLTLGRVLDPGLLLTAAVVGTDADRTLYATPAGRPTGRSGLVLGARFTF